MQAALRVFDCLREREATHSSGETPTGNGAKLKRSGRGSRRSYRNLGQADRRAGETDQANRSVACTSASTFSSSNAECPDAGVIVSSAFGQAFFSSQAFCTGQTTS